MESIDIEKWEESIDDIVSNNKILEFDNLLNNNNYEQIYYAIYKILAIGNYELYNIFIKKNILSLSNLKMIINNDSYTLMYVACFGGNIDICKDIYLQFPKTLSLKTKYHDFPIMIVCEMGYVDIIKWIYENDKNQVFYLINKILIVDSDIVNILERKDILLTLKNIIFTDCLMTDIPGKYYKIGANIYTHLQLHTFFSLCLSNIGSQIINEIIHK